MTWPTATWYLHPFLHICSSNQPLVKGTPVFPHIPFLKLLVHWLMLPWAHALDICAAVRSLSPFTTMFVQEHINGVKHIMCYLTGFLNHGIMYMMGESRLVGSTNMDWANDHINCCSVSGHAFLYSGGVVSWPSKQQSTITTLSAHAEYIVAAEALKELVWLHWLLSKLCKGMSESTWLCIDNWAANLLAHSPVNHTATKHNNISGTNDMGADILMKALTSPSMSDSFRCSGWRLCHRGMVVVRLGECCKWQWSDATATVGYLLPI